MPTKKSTKPRKQSGKRIVAPKKPAPRADLGKPIDGFFAKQPPGTRPILLELRQLVELLVPDANSSIKWGMPFYTLDGNMMVALGGHKAHVNLILAGTQFDDPDGLLQGEGKTGKHVKIAAGEKVPRAAVTKLIRQAAAKARR